MVLQVEIEDFFNLLGEFPKLLQFLGRFPKFANICDFRGKCSLIVESLFLQF